MFNRISIFRALAVCAVLLFTPRAGSTAEVLCDPGFQNCRTPLFQLIQNEMIGIDVAMLFMEDKELANAIIARFKAGVPVRALVEPRRTATTPLNGVILDMFRAAGIPMRNRISGGMLHWKFMLFEGQDKVQFSAANYSDYYFRPITPYLNYTDEAIYFCDDQAVVNSFRTKFDDTWINTTAFRNYANVTTLRRHYSVFPIDPNLNFVPAQDFLKRSIPLYDRETTKIDVIMYKITDAGHTDGLLRAARRGVPVRVITEPDLYRNRGNVWQAYNVDRLYAAGIPVRVRAHAGFLHEKATLLYSQAMTIFGSSNWTKESNNSQYEHNYFTTKSSFFTWFRANFERKWGNRTGNAETKAFTPLPPDAPINVAPVNGAINISTSSTVSLSWKPGPWAHLADVYFGTSSTPPRIATNVRVSPSTTKTYALPALSPGTRYYWRIVSKTMALVPRSGPVHSFTTAAGTAPPSPDASEIVLHAGDAPVILGTRSVQPDGAAGKPVQFSGSGLESCSGCGLSGWGWEDNWYGTGVLGPAIDFATTGTQRIRIQNREDGLSIDQIVLSPSKYRTTGPGATKNDTAILPANSGS